MSRPYQNLDSSPCWNKGRIADFFSLFFLFAWNSEREQAKEAQYVRQREAEKLKAAKAKLAEAQAEVVSRLPSSFTHLYPLPSNHLSPQRCISYIIGSVACADECLFFLFFVGRYFIGEAAEGCRLPELSV